MENIDSLLKQLYKDSLDLTELDICAIKAMIIFITESITDKQIEEFKTRFGSKTWDWINHYRKKGN